MALKRVLIANRGEIAVRIIRACHDLGIEAVQVYSRADENALPVKLADKSVLIGEAPAAQSYLRPERLIAAAIESDCDAVHPGYGFLSENAAFAELCANAGLCFVGPSAEIIALMGDKSAARRAAISADVPVTPGSADPVTDVGQALTEARKIGFPVLIKASAGGGGRGMRVVDAEAGFGAALDSASREAEGAFGNGAVYIEKYMSRVRHIEVQVMGDGTDVVHFGERDCSVQRRHQKLVEESPSPALGEDQRRDLAEAACKLARKVGYRGAGTMEFILDPASGQFYFIEMNTRIQVEHPVTELVTGWDLVKMQLEIAATGRLPVTQDQIAFTGHAIECRINAEDPERGFMPRPGRLQELSLPSGPGVRVDSHVYPGYDLPPFYDSLMAKIITWGRDREEALARMKRALGETVISGVPSTVSFHQRLLDEPAFRSGDVHTRFVRESMWAGHPMQNML